MSAFPLYEIFDSDLLPGEHGFQPCRKVADDLLLARLKPCPPGVRNPSTTTAYFPSVTISEKSAMVENSFNMA
jgi:hypothetical protein